MKTSEGWDVALRVVIWYRRKEGLPDQFHPDEFVDENLKHYMSRFCLSMANVAVPFRCDENLEPTTGNLKRVIKPEAVLGYTGRHLAEIRSAITHTDFEKLRK